MKKLLMLTLAVVLSGCSIFQPVTSKIAPAVIYYCAQPYAARLVIRDSINSGLTGTDHRIEVHCKGDPNGTT